MTEPEPVEYIAVANGEGVTFYAHDEFIGAFQEAFLEKLAILPSGASVRSAMRHVRSMRNKVVHRAVLRRAIELLDERGNVVPSEEARQGQLAAVLPVAG